MTLIRKFVSAAVTDPALSPRQIRVTASTGAQDRQGDVVEPRGCLLDNYKRNPIVLYQHDPTVPVGTARVEVVGDRVEAVVTFAQAGISPKADEVCGLYKSGVMRGVSIGFSAIDQEPLSGGGTRFVKWELLELSCVSVPANQESVLIARGYRGRRKSAGASSDNGIDHLQGVAEALAGAKRAAKTAIEAHEATLDHLAAMGGWMIDGHRHAQALARAGFPGASDHPLRDDDETGEPEGAADDDADVELAARVARRKSRLDALDRAEVGAVARAPAVREVGGAFVTQQVRAAAQARIWDAYR